MAEQEKTIQKKKPRRKRHILRRLFVMLIVLVLIAGGALYAWTSLKAEYTVTYTGYTATTGSISNALSFSGSLALIDSKTYTASADTTVRAVYVRPGDEVKEGDKLLRLASGETVKADFDGRVNTVSVEEGDEVVAGDALVQLADFAHMKVSIRVDEYDIADVHVGQRCTVTATATEKEFESTVAAIDYISASAGNVAYYTATAYVDVAADSGVYPGMQVTVTVPQEEAVNVVVLKMEALSFDENNSAYVYMYNEEEVLVEVPVEVGVSNGNYVEIKSGLKDGDEVYVQVEEASPTTALFQMMSSMFGEQRMMPGNRDLDFSNMPGNSDLDFSNMPGGRDFATPPGSSRRNTGGDSQ